MVRRIYFYIFAFSLFTSGCEEPPEVEPLYTPPSYMPDEGWKVANLNESERIQACMGMVLYQQRGRIEQISEIEVLTVIDDSVFLSHKWPSNKIGKRGVECLFTHNVIQTRNVNPDRITDHMSWHHGSYNFSLKEDVVAFKQVDSNTRHFPVTVK